MDPHPSVQDGIKIYYTPAGGASSHNLYKDGVLQKSKSYAHAFPDMLTFHDAPTVIEQKLFVMCMEHRMRTFQGAFHNNPDYTLWYGWSEMQRDLTEIKERAAELRERAKAKEK